ncbi:hypothetical protein V8B97DRAFT_1863880 [Scleroderma yunnanense]
MDVVVHHCIRELSFDGDLGCNVSRLRDFIVAFYNNHDGPQQIVDDAFCAFLWSVIVQQLAVRVGVVPPGITSEVYVAPQARTKRKAAAKGEDVVEDTPPTLQIIENARQMSLDELKHRYGDVLRIAVDPETSFVAITGSHIRPAKLSPMVYTALQLITRGREEGITTVELGRKTKYDQKTCFYVIKQLIELGLVIKARRGGVGNYTCIHKYFVERSPFWQQIQQEEAHDGEIFITGANVQFPGTVEEAAASGEAAQITFDPIDGRHLSSLQLVKNRVVRLLRASANHMHASNNLLVAVGFKNPTKTDRRFFRTRLRELIQQGIIERVLVPHTKSRDRMIKCIRLVEPDGQLPEGSIVGGQDVDEEEKDAVFGTSDGYTDVKSHLTIHKQVFNLLEEAGSSGLTLQEICTSLGNFDKRTIELLLTRAARNPPPSHLRDLGTVDVMETYGRERRHRYFTISTYIAVTATENLQDTYAHDIDPSRIGEFAEIDDRLFYANDAELCAHLDSFKDKSTNVHKGKQKEASVGIDSGKKRKRASGDISGDEGEGAEAHPTPKRGRPRKTTAVDSPQVPKKRGRPRKHPPSGDEEDPMPKRRGRPPKRLKSRTTTRDKDETLAAPPCTGVENAPPSQAVPMEEIVPSRFTTKESGGRKGKLRTVETESVGDGHSGEVDESVPLPESGRVLVTRSSATSGAPPQSLPFIEVHDQQPPGVVGTETITTVKPCNVEASTREASPMNLITPKSPLIKGQIGLNAKGNALSGSLVAGPSKRVKTALPGDNSRSGINISALRRENELYRIIEQLGGIANLHSKEIYEAHMALLDTMARDNEPTSAPVGTRLDKRTAEATLRSLENRGRIKMLKTSVISASGASKPACLLYLPDTSQEKLNEYIRQLGQGPPPVSAPAPVKTLDEPVEFGAGHRRSRRPSIPAVEESVMEPQDRDDVLTQQVSNNNSLVSSPSRQKRRERSKRREHAQTNSEAIAALQKKVEEARRRREEDWENLLGGIHPEPVKGTLAAHMRAVRSRFIDSTYIKDYEHWENEIRKTIKETELAAKKIISRPQRLPASFRRPIAPPPTVVNPPEKSIAALITQQGPSIAQHTRSKGKGKEKEDAEGKSSQRRSRFHWTREFDELARDASAIVRARCRDMGRLDLSAFDQAFPAVPRNSVRQRIAHLRENAADDLYMKRLEDQWYTVWVQHRGTVHLPDDDPQSPSNFDLVKHLEFLRKHVDKNALRVGFVEREAVVKLPSSVEELSELFEIERNAVTTPPWDFMWSSAVDEGREKQFLSHPFTREPGIIVAETTSSNVGTAEAALKMVFGTPSELYDPDSGARLLHSVGRKPVSAAISHLLSQGVLSKLMRDPKKPKPGRTLKISDINLNAIGGPFPSELFQDANALDDIMAEGDIEGMEWSLDAHDGDIATLLQLVSEDQVSLDVDTSYPRSARPRIDWNSKRADDDDIETSIYVKFSTNVPAEPEALENGYSETPLGEPESMMVDNDGNVHNDGTSDESIIACALKTSHGIVNCPRCLTVSLSKFTADLSQADAELARSILVSVKASESVGVAKSALPQFSTCPGRILDLVQRMTSLSPPVLFWTGYVTPVLVASENCIPWTAIVSDHPITFVLPRRWLGVRGSRLNDFWMAALRAIVGTVILRPGIPQAELRWRLRAVYDRQEVLEVLTFLELDGTLEAKVNTRDNVLEEIKVVPGWAATLEEGEEQKVYWFIGKNRHWYRV